MQRVDWMIFANRFGARARQSMSTTDTVVQETNVLPGLVPHVCAFFFSPSPECSVVDTGVASLAPVVPIRTLFRFHVLLSFDVDKRGVSAYPQTAQSKPKELPSQHQPRLVLPSQPSRPRRFLLHLKDSRIHPQGQKRTISWSFVE